MEAIKTILVSTYAVNPYKGSEDGMGWNFILQIARFNKVIAVTRMNNREHIERYQKENANPLYERITFLYFDLPYWMRFWKKGGRGAMLYYLMWQRGVIPFVKRRDLSFDIVHNLNFHNDWTPSYLWKLGKPFVWGPIGHHPLIPSQYLEPYRKSYWLKDRLTWLVKKYFWRFSLPLKATVAKADYIWCMNQSVPSSLDLKDADFSIMPSVATQDFGMDKDVRKDKFTLISAGRLVPLKGFDLSIRSFAEFWNSLPEAEREKAELVIIGSGPEKDHYKRMAGELGVESGVVFVEWIERGKLMQMMRNASVFLFPSHEGAGMVVAEALSFGLPVICLDNCGPGEFIDDTCGITVPIQSYQQTVQELAAGISSLYHDRPKHQKLSDGARERFLTRFHWDRRGEQLHSIYSSLAG